MLCDDKVSNDSDSKENKKSASKKLKQSGEATTSATTTSFDPFGKFKVMLECNRMVLRKAVDKLIESFQSESNDQAKLFLKRRPEATQLVIELKKVQTTIRTLAKSSPIAVTSALTMYIPSLAKLADQFSKQLTNVRSGDIMLISQTVAEFLNSIGEFCQAPYSSELLEDWCILFESFLKSNVAILKTSAINLWRKTFAKNSGKIKYPNSTLRNLLINTTAKPPLVVPEADDKEETVDQFVEEEAMDGIEVLNTKTRKSPVKSKVTGFAEPANPKSQESQSSFELSQQPNFDNLARKLISEKSAPSQPSTPESSKKRKAAEKLLIDEDSCDFVVIKTPASGKKNKLTDHQMEKFEESRDGINYINEDSQSGTQRQANLKNALTTFNFEVQPTSESSSSTVAPDAPNVDNLPRKLGKRQRRSLFTDDAVKDETAARKTRSKKIKLQDETVKTVEECMVDTNPDTGEDSSSTLPVMEISKTLTVAKPPVEKPAPEELSPVKSETAIESSSDTSEEKEENDQKKRKSRVPKKLVAQQITPRRKSSRHTTVKESEVVESSQEPSPQKSPQKTPQKSPQKSPQKTAEAEKIVEPVEEKVTNECVDEAAQKTPSPAKVEEAELPVLSTPSNRKIPDAASTPSILRKTPVGGTPLTEKKKKNRVHFDAESLDIETRKSASPKRMQPPTPMPVSTSVSKERSCSPQQVEKTSSSLFDMEIESGPIYPDLKGCDDAVDVLVRLLVPFSGVVTAMSILRKSFSTAGIKTVGQLSQLTKAQIMKINGIRTPRDKTARKVLTEYDANSKKLLKYASIPQFEESPKHTKEIKTTPEPVRKMEVAAVKPVVEAVEPARKMEIASVKPVVEAVEPARKMDIASVKPVVEVKPEDTKDQSTERVVGGPIDEPVAEVAKVPEEAKHIPEPVIEKPENVPDVQVDALKEAEELDRLVRSISRKMGREKFAAEISSQIDDRLYDTFLVLRGLVKERGFNNV